MTTTTVSGAQNKNQGPAHRQNMGQENNTCRDSNYNILLYIHRCRFKYAGVGVVNKQDLLIGQHRAIVLPSYKEWWSYV